MFVFLYGNIKVPVRKIYFKEREHNNACTQSDQLNEYKYKLQMTQQKLFGLEQQYHNLDLALNEKDRYIEKYQKIYMNMILRSMKRIDI